MISYQSYGMYFNSRQRQPYFVCFFYRWYKFETSTCYRYLEPFVLPFVEGKLSLETVVETIEYDAGDRNQQKQKQASVTN